MSEDVKNETVNEESTHTVTKEEFKVNGEAIVSKVREIVREGNIRRITIKNDEDKTLLEIPLSLGVVGGLLLPTFAAIGAIGALIANLSITVERVEPKETANEEEVATEEPILEAVN